MRNAVATDREQHWPQHWRKHSPQHWPQHWHKRELDFCDDACVQGNPLPVAQFSQAHGLLATCRLLTGCGEELHAAEPGMPGKEQRALAWEGVSSRWCGSLFVFIGFHSSSFVFMLTHVSSCACMLRPGRPGVSCGRKCPRIGRDVQAQLKHSSSTVQAQFKHRPYGRSTVVASASALGVVGRRRGSSGVVGRRHPEVW
jgi:hypothetical protein